MGAGGVAMRLGWIRGVGVGVGCWVVWVEVGVEVVCFG